MSGWDVVGGAVDQVVTDVLKVFSPAGSIALDVMKGLGGPGTQGPLGPPPPPPSLPEGAGGPAAEAAAENARRIGQTLEQLATLDQSGISSEDIAASGEVGRKELENIRADVAAKISEMKGSGALYTPEGQLKLGEYIKTRLEEAKAVIEKAAADAEDKAEAVNEQSEKYRQVAENDGGGGTCACGSCGGTTGGAGETTTGPGETITEEAGTAPAGQPTGAVPLGTGMPGLGGGLPGLGGGGMPSLGGGLPGSFMDPLSGALGNLGQSGADEGLAFSDEPDDGLGETDDGLGEDRVQADGGDGEASEREDSPGDGTDEEDVDQGVRTEPAAVAEATGDEQPSGPAPKSTEVQLPNGDTAEARSAQGARAVQAALNGAPVAEAYQQNAGITLPPAGSPVTEPVPPTKLMAGDVGMWKDHQVMALGDGKVLVSGQVQPLESVGSGPDFLGWFDPTASGPANTAPAD